jgi:drug/metabolite transporter (DMT)-like permease
MVAKPVGTLEALLLVALIIFWGSSFVVVKMALAEGLTPVSIATFRFLLAGGLFVVILMLKAVRKSGDRSFVKRGDLPILVSLAVSGITLFYLAQYIGIEMAGASIAAIFACFLSPIFIAIVSTAVLKERISRGQVSGIGFAAVGTLVVVLGGSVSVQSGSDFFYGSVVLLATPILWTFYTILGKRAIEKYNPILVLTYVTVLGGLLLLPFSVADGSVRLVQSMSLYSWSAIAYLSITCTLVGYYIWFYAVEKVGATVTSAFLFAEPLVTVLLAALLVDEKITVPIGIGGLLIFLGVYLVTRK